MKDNGYTYVDEAGAELNVGDQVVCCGGVRAELTLFTDWDGDADDEGRSFVIPPKAEVTFSEDGSTETFHCHNGYPDDTIVFDELRKVTD